MEIQVEDLLAIIGEKEVETRFLRQRIAELEEEKAAAASADEQPPTVDECDKKTARAASRRS